MPKFRKKPIVVEAFQPAMTKYKDWPLWATAAKEAEELVRITTWGAFKLLTLEGYMPVNPGDWIIRGVKGELYPCKDEIFRQTYEEVEE
ncbi:hypothetical protein [Candidatus Igneacidithiobacillus taiwanensis]|uniref:hypothetical protein n=1 Tax=Candidatus Igneacidithiobacillus taiwanensis TaxID=1945924 RepID=UPI0028A13ACD|nr:hypothetical protein [Candidatus Igneacidithiobacillus taiwanensis]